MAPARVSDKGTTYGYGPYGTCKGARASMPGYNVRGVSLFCTTVSTIESNYRDDK